MILLEARPHEMAPVGANETMRVRAHPALELMRKRGVFDLSHVQTSIVRIGMMPETKPASSMAPTRPNAAPQR
jgi:hypothetical protein